MIKIKVKSSACRSIDNRHPWLFSGAVCLEKQLPVNGEQVMIVDENRKFFCYGTFSLNSKIAVRIWSFDEKEPISYELISKRISEALQKRKLNPLLSEGNSMRIIFSESDMIPGLIVDKIGSWVVCQFSSAGAVYFKNEIIKAIKQNIECDGIYERSDSDIMQKEGIESNVGVLFGSEPPDFLTVEENGLKYKVNIKSGHKTGFYLDQRLNRLAVAKYVKDKTVLDCFSYSGGFALNCLSVGVSKVTCVDSSCDALTILKDNIISNNLDLNKVEIIEAKVGEQLRKFRDSRKSFDIIILDPPKFINDRKNLESGMRAYKDINLLAMKLLNKNGILASFSCSQPMQEHLFKQMIAYAAKDSGKDVQIIEKLLQSPDHPILTNFPESEYLKGVIAIAN